VLTDTQFLSFVSALDFSPKHTQPQKQPADLLRIVIFQTTLRVLLKMLLRVSVYLVDDILKRSIFKFLEKSGVTP
jgi:hypothetical protein